MGRRTYRDLLRGDARNQSEEQLRERINELRALAEIIVEIYATSTPAAQDASEMESIDDYAETLAEAGIPLRDAQRLARVNLELNRQSDERTARE